jgi:non-heme chloroperoxidase
MSTITVKEGTTIFYKDWGSGPVVTFSHGWPLCSDAWDGQMLFLAQNGFRVVAHDRRGHGRSSQAWSGNDMNGYADDLAALIEALDLTDVTMVGHSTGGGEVARYIGRHGTKRVAAAVLIGAVPPVMAKSAANPDGVPIEVFDGLRSGVAKDRSQFWKDFAIMFYGANRRGAKVSQGMHGEDDQIVPIGISGRKSAKLIKGAKEIFYPGLPHGLTATNADQVNADLLEFLKSVQRARRASA